MEINLKLWLKEKSLNGELILKYCPQYVGGVGDEMCMIIS